MGFILCQLKPLPENRLRIERGASIPLAGPSGILAGHLPSVADEDGKWNLSAEDLCHLIDPALDSSHAIVFDLTPRSAGKVNFYRLKALRGRTASLITDVLFHFKVIRPFATTCDGVRHNIDLSITDWNTGPEHHEYLRLDGGTRGGTWAWTDPPQALSATILQ